MPGSKRILILPGYYLPHIGGVETHVDEFAKYLSQDSDFEVTIMAPNIPKAPTQEIRHGRVKVFRYPAFELISNYPCPAFWHPLFWRLFIKVYFEENFDFIMTRTRFFLSSLLGLFLAKFRLRPKILIHVEHGSSFVILESSFKTYLARIYDIILGRLIFRSADLVLAISEAVKEFVEKHFLFSRSIPVVRRGLEIDFLDAVPPATKFKEDLLKRTGKSLIIGFVGRLLKWKGVENLINAYFSLPENICRKLLLVIVGYGEDEERLKDLAGKALGREIHFTGKVSFREAVALTKAFDIYVHPSLPGGGLATTLLQAMACRLPIVATPYEGAKEVIFHKKTGFLLRDSNPREIAKGIKYLLEHPEEAKVMGQNARRLVEEKFSWPRQIEVFKKILASHGLI